MNKCKRYRTFGNNKYYYYIKFRHLKQESDTFINFENNTYLLRTFINNSYYS